MLYDLKLPIEAKPFSIGARIEHLRQKVDKAQYGRFAGNKKLGSANYKLSTHLDNGRGVYTFCVQEARLSMRQAKKTDFAPMV